MYRSLNITSITTGLVSGAGAELGTVNINTGAGSAVLTLYNALSADAAKKIATIDASTKSSHAFVIYCENGLFYALSGGNADVTIGFQ